jgi:flavin-dependent dehydrogenase
MDRNKTYDAAIVGGGQAGLSLSIRLAGKGYSVILFEKEVYPFHKVCGEYVSMESRDYLISLGLAVDDMKLPLIDTLFLSAPDGTSLTTKLPLGGFGISRYLMDQALSAIARKKGVEVRENCRVDQITFDGLFEVDTQGGKISSRTCFASYGKRSNLDVKWKRSFLQQQDKRLNNYVGVKYHILTDWKQNIIGLHNFENGYCGISKIEDNKYCLCYMTRADNLKKAGNDIQVMEREILFQNPHLKNIFESSDFLPGFPITISQINFSNKTRVEDHVIMTGDAAGMITPLCGNGMSIALHTGKIASDLADRFLKNEIDREEMEKGYTREWDHNFKRRLKTGRLLQKFFGKKRPGNLFVRSFKLFPFLARPLIRLTHGKPF